MYENVKNFFSWLDLSSFWRFNFSLQNNSLKLLEFFLYYFTKRWTLGKNSRNSNGLSPYPNASSSTKSATRNLQNSLMFLDAFFEFLQSSRKMCHPSAAWCKIIYNKKKLTSIKASGLLYNFFFFFAEFRLSTIFHSHWHSVYCTMYVQSRDFHNKMAIRVHLGLPFFLFFSNIFLFFLFFAPRPSPALRSSSGSLANLRGPRTKCTWR